LKNRRFVSSRRGIERDKSVAPPWADRFITLKEAGHEKLVRKCGQFDAAVFAVLLRDLGVLGSVFP